MIDAGGEKRMIQTLQQVLEERMIRNPKGGAPAFMIFQNKAERAGPVRPERFGDGLGREGA